MDQLSGRTLGRHLLEKVLASGGMGAVYRAVYARLRQPRAVKVLPPPRALDEDFVARFQREATVAAGLHHPHIVQTFDVYEHEGLHCTAMEPVEGVSLRKLLAHQGALPVRRALHILSQRADALVHAHAEGVVHRDLNSANVLICADDHVALLGLGIAHAVKGTRLTRTGGMMTPGRDPTATLLPNGAVRVAGSKERGIRRLSSAELYDPGGAR